MKYLVVAVLLSSFFLTGCFEKKTEPQAELSTGSTIVEEDVSTDDMEDKEDETTDIDDSSTGTTSEDEDETINTDDSPEENSSEDTQETLDEYEEDLETLFNDLLSGSE